MISTTIVAEVVTVDGTAAWTDPFAGPGFRTFQATPPATFGDSQPGRIPVTITHGGPLVGHVDYLECGLGYGNGGLYAVAVLEDVDADDVNEQVMCSPEIKADAIATTVGRGRDARMIGTMHATVATLEAVALVNETASVTSTRVRAWPGDYRDSVERGRWDRRHLPKILDRAVAAAGWNLRYSRPRRLQIHRPDEVDLAWRGGHPAGVEVFHSAPYRGVISVRSA